MEQDRIPLAIGVVIAAAVLGALVFAGLVVAAIIAF